jgi:hypothetical protein
VLLGVAWLVYIAGAPAVCGWLMIAAFVVLVAGEQVDRMARLVAWLRA